MCPYKHFVPSRTKLSNLAARIGSHCLRSFEQLVVATARFEAVTEAIVDAQQHRLSAPASAG